MRSTTADQLSTPGRLAPISPRYRSLDIWRGIACLQIVVLHASFYAQHADVVAERQHHPIASFIMGIVWRMGVGVPMFFVISGYCISATADSTRRKGGSALEYFRRRIRRIFPPYWAAIGLTIALWASFHTIGHDNVFAREPRVDTGSVPAPTSLAGAQWVGNLTLTEQWRYHVWGGPSLKILGPAWTLCYEEQFYVVCGLLLFLAGRFFLGAFIISILTAATFAISARFGLSHFDGFFFDGNWLMFAAGVFVYYFLNYSSPASRIVPYAIASCVFGLVVFRYGFLRHSQNGPVKEQTFNLLFSGSFALLILLLRPVDLRLSSMAVLAPIAWCGRMCYSLYLVHYPLSKLISHLLFMNGVRGYWPTLLITVPVVTGAALAVAWAFYELVEKRFLNPPSGAVVRPARIADDVPSLLLDRTVRVPSL